MQYFLFTVSTESWKEHFATGIAAINDPGIDPNNRQGNAQRQKAMCELAGLKKETIYFFICNKKKRLWGYTKLTQNHSLTPTN